MNMNLSGKGVKIKPYKSNQMVTSFYDESKDGSARNYEGSEASASFKIRNTNKYKPNI